MRKFSILLAAAALSFTAAAQDQLPNNGFEEAWGECTPWTSAGNTTAYGITPASWTISHVIGINGLGQTLVGGETAGFESDKAVNLTCNPNPLMATQIVPGYVTLGTTWSTSVMGKSNDGGTFGGTPFTGRPYKIAFKYRRTLGGEGNSQPATAVAYLWKGTFSQADVPGNIGMMATQLKKTDMVDRDRNILGMETATGGAVTKSEGAELIAKGIVLITKTSDEWIDGEIVLEYLSDATPEKINVIFAANDYFGEASAIEANNTFSVDDITCVYEEKEEPVPAGDPIEYTGKLVVEMMGGELTTPGGEDASITITPMSDGSVQFFLPDLTLGDLGTVGDIKLQGVKAETSGNVTTYTGHDPNFYLENLDVTADVTLNGTVTGNDADMKIDVVWEGIPVNVTFKGALKNGIESIMAGNAATELYDLNGVRVNPDTTRPGLYIRRNGTQVTKVLVR